MPGNESTPYYTLVGEKDSCFVGKRVILDPIKLLRFEAPSVDIAAALRPSVIRAQQHVFPINGKYEWQPLEPQQQKLWHFGMNASRVLLFGDSTMLQPTAIFRAAEARCQFGQTADHDMGCLPTCSDFYLPPGNLETYISKIQTLYPPFSSCRLRFYLEGRFDALVTSEQEALAGLPIAHINDDITASMWVHYVNGHGCDTDAMARLTQMLNGMQPHDILIVNIGLHCVKSITLSKWKTLIQEIGRLLSSAPTRHIIWRSSMPIEEYRPWPFLDVEALQYRRSTHHFLNEPRRIVFELLASAVMKRHGIRVLDLVGLPVAHYDATHYDLAGADLLNRLLSWSICG